MSVCVCVCILAHKTSRSSKMQFSNTLPTLLFKISVLMPFYGGGHNHFFDTFQWAMLMTLKSMSSNKNDSNSDTVTEQSLWLNDLMKLIISRWLIIWPRITDSIQQGPHGKKSTLGGSSSVETRGNYKIHSILTTLMPRKQQRSLRCKTFQEVNSM